MSEDPPKEIDEALRIARNTRDSILEGKTKIQSNLRGFLTVSQIMNRTKELSWAKNELSGYDHFSEIPKYRLNCFGHLDWVESGNNETLSSNSIPVSISVPKLGP